MAEPFDVYSDAFALSTTPWGTSLVFGLSPAVLPSAPAEESTQLGTVPMSIEPMQLGTVRMSNEHLKVVVFALWRNVLLHEENMGVQLGVPVQVLDQLGIPKDGWDSLWTQAVG